MNRFYPAVGHRPTCGEAKEGPAGSFLAVRMHGLFFARFSLRTLANRGER